MKDREKGIPCKPALAVFNAVHDTSVSRAWNHNDPKWYHSEWHVSTWAKQYENITFRGGDFNINLCPVSNLLPWQFKPKGGGRPTKVEQAALADIEEQKRAGKARTGRKCGACGYAGHYYSVCPIMDLDRYCKK